MRERRRGGSEFAEQLLHLGDLGFLGAVDMAQQEIGAGKNPASIQLARDIIAAQEAEITEMKELLGKL